MIDQKRIFRSAVHGKGFIRPLIFAVASLILWIDPSANGFVSLGVRPHLAKTIQYRDANGNKPIFTSPPSQRRKKLRTAVQAATEGDDSETSVTRIRDYSPRSTTKMMDRRTTLRMVALTTLAMPLVAHSATVVATEEEPLEQIAFAKGQWTNTHDHQHQETQSAVNDLETTTMLPDEFCLYLTRFLIHYDAGMKMWWEQQVLRTDLLAKEQQETQLTNLLGSLSKSIRVGLENELQASESGVATPHQRTLEQIYDRLVDAYGANADTRFQLGLLFAMLPADLQPTSRLDKIASNPKPAASTNSLANDHIDQLVALLDPIEYSIRRISPRGNYQVVELSDNSALSLSSWLSASMISNLDGLAPLSRDLPRFSALTYAWLGLSGGTGCALTHAVVIPLDVVKTRAQTNPEEYSDVWNGAVQIARQEGMSGLFLGAQATLAGYLWYGISVYPCYTLFKRTLSSLSQNYLDVAFATAHVTEIALLAGALASVVASLGLTPLEAARIRVVADPDMYRSLGLVGTLRRIAAENRGDWKSLYDGLPSLLTRQVIFGSVKFLAFERACEFIFTQAPVLREATWTSLSVSLMAGAFAGALSSVVSQPADSVLTYVARNGGGNADNDDDPKSGRRSMGVLEGSLIMMEQEGVASLFRGLGSRCVWASSIIAGQFLLYDVFRTWFGVSSVDLSQVYQVIWTSSR